ncbi:putative Phage integrase [Cupriavidus taiwanensis]|uniref:site-specific integrase n=1 Tax=Cupriavidus taiwanensis TaxID=164546 RepID=UPI000E120914|nr:site-specific integrase [Cupriavidus taiwanensis]SOZ99794.1 putative Phage integrase [Cupriavidus taiwanensis]
MQHPYLTTRGNSTQLYFRRAIPPHLRAAAGRREIWLSLRTACPKTALTRLPQAALYFEHCIAQAEAAMGQAAGADAWMPPALRAAVWSTLPPSRSTMAATIPSTLAAAAPEVGADDECLVLTPLLIPGLLERYRAHALASDAEQRQGLSDAELDERLALLEAAATQTRRARARGDAQSMRAAAEDMLAAEGVVADPASPAFGQLLEQLLASEVAVLDEEIARTRGDGGVADPSLNPLVDPDDTWSAALSLWQTERAPAAKTVDEVTKQVARFQGVVGRLPLSQLSPAHVDVFKAHCQAAGLSLSRINTVVSLLSPLLTLAIKKGHTALAKNPFAGMKYETKAVRKATATVRDAFSVDELNMLFASPVFVQGQRPAKGGGEAAYWLPLLGLFTGARLEDLCRLTLTDVVEREGVWCLHLHDSKREQRLGVAAVLRYVPLHVELLRCGFLVHVAAARQARSTGFLFPDLHTNQYGQRSAVFSNWFNPYLDSVGLDDPRLVFHSLRHTFQHFSELSGSNDATIDELIGHAPDQRYGHKEGGEKRLPFPLLLQAMARFHIPGLDLGHLYRGPAASCATATPTA